MRGEGPWDSPARSEEYSIVTKRRRFERFREGPTVENLVSFAESWWAYLGGSSEYRVREWIVGDGYSAAEFLDGLRAVRDGRRPVMDVTELPGVGLATGTELLEVMDPERFATLNRKTRMGMQALDLPVPGERPSEQEYRAVVTDLQEAAGAFGLRGRIAADDVPVHVHPALSDVDVAQVAFEMHDKDRFEFDLGSVERVR